MLFIIRGLPGSGKTTLAKSMRVTVHIEADQWFDNSDREWTPENAVFAHAWCKAEVARFLESDPSVTVIVANTFIRRNHVREYQDLATAFGHKTCVITCRGRWKSVHNVPAETVERMAQNFEEL